MLIDDRESVIGSIRMARSVARRFIDIDIVARNLKF